jgi:hypothetical protein
MFTMIENVAGVNYSRTCIIRGMLRSRSPLPQQKKRGLRYCGKVLQSAFTIICSNLSSSQRRSISIKTFLIQFAQWENYTLQLNIGRRHLMFNRSICCLIRKFLRQISQCSLMKQTYQKEFPNQHATILVL